MDSHCNSIRYCTRLVHTHTHTYIYNYIYIYVYIYIYIYIYICTYLNGIPIVISNSKVCPTSTNLPVAVAVAVLERPVKLAC